MTPGSNRTYNPEVTMYKPKCMPNNLSEQLKGSVNIIFLFNQLLSEETIWPHCLKLTANYPCAVGPRRRFKRSKA